jgi:hypothetical protein
MNAPQMDSPAETVERLATGLVGAMDVVRSVRQDLPEEADHVRGRLLLLDIALEQLFADVNELVPALADKEVA